MKPLLAASVAAAVALASRHGKVPKVEPAPASSETGGYVAVYLGPLAPPARALAMKVDAVAAVRDGGGAAPLRVLRADLGGAEAGRERLLAWGTVPEGAYSGIEIRLRSAVLGAAEGSRTVDLRGAPASASLPFSVSSRRGALIQVAFDEAASRGGNGGLAPVFVPSVPSKIASGLIGAVSSPAAGVVTLFDKVSGQVSSVVPVGRSASALALDAARNRLYVALPEEDAVATVDLLSATVIATTPLRAGDEPVSLALAPDGRTLVVANAGSATAAVLDASGPTLVERTRAAVGSGPAFVLADPSGTRAWVFCSLDDAITVLALPGGTVAGSVASAGGPLRGVLNRAGSRLFVIHRSSPYLDAVDTSTLAVAGRAYVGPAAAAIALDPQTDRIYLGFRDSGRIEVYDPAALLPVDAVRTVSGAGYLTIDPEGNNLCVLLPRSDALEFIRLSGKAVAARADVPGPAEAVLQGGR